jgi:hypothetical protein
MIAAALRCVGHADPWFQKLRMLRVQCCEALASIGAHARPERRVCHTHPRVEVGTIEHERGQETFTCLAVLARPCVRIAEAVQRCDIAGVGAEQDGVSAHGIIRATEPRVHLRELAQRDPVVLMFQQPSSEIVDRMRTDRRRPSAAVRASRELGCANSPLLKASVSVTTHKQRAMTRV